ATKLKSVSRGQPCQLCQATVGCSIGADGLMLCRRREGDQTGFVCFGRADGDPQWTMYRREGDPRLQDGGNRHRSNNASNNGKPAVDWRARAAGFAHELTPDRANELAEVLGLPVAVLSELPLLGFCANGPHHLGECCTFPEVDG